MPPGDVPVDLGVLRPRRRYRLPAGHPISDRHGDPRPRVGRQRGTRGVHVGGGGTTTVGSSGGAPGPAGPGGRPWVGPWAAAAAARNAMIGAWRSGGRLSPNPTSSASIACRTRTKAATSASPFTSHAVTTPSTATTRALIRAVWWGLRARNKPLTAWTMLETIPKVRAGNRARLIGVPSDHRFRAVNHWTEVVASARLAELHWWWPSQRRNAVASATSTSPTSAAGSGTVSPGGVGGPACRPRVGSGAAAGAG